MALWPAGLRSRHKSRALEAAYTGLSFPYTPRLTGYDSCAAEVTAPAPLHHSPSVGPAAPEPSACEGSRPAASAVCSTTTNPKAVRRFPHQFRRSPEACCANRAHASVRTATCPASAAIVIDPLGSALVSLWVYQKTQHGGRIVKEGKRKAMRAHCERALMTGCGGYLVND